MKISLNTTSITGDDIIHSKGLIANDCESEKARLIDELLTKNIEGAATAIECGGGACGTPVESGGGGCGGGGAGILIF